MSKLENFPFPGAALGQGRGKGSKVIQPLRLDFKNSESGQIGETGVHTDLSGDDPASAARPLIQFSDDLPASTWNAGEDEVRDRQRSELGQCLRGT